jgi:hypothetical protein
MCSLSHSLSCCVGRCLLVLTVLVSVLADGRLDVPWFLNIQIILGAGTGLSFMLGLLDKPIP